MKPSELSELIADVREQVLYLQEFGVETLAIDLPEVVSSRFKVQDTKSQTVSDPAPIRTVPADQTLKSRAPGSRLASLPSVSNRTAHSPSGRTVETSAQRMRNENQTVQNPKSDTRNQDETLFGDLGPALPESGETIESIRTEIGNCTRCPLHVGRTHIVHSNGNLNADLMFVGEAPGADEDEQGLPFVGRAGQLLTKIIEGIGMKREDVLIGNINRCRPPGNRKPESAETKACKPFLIREISVVRPKVIVVMGNTATQNLLDIKTPISKLRGNFQDYFGVKVMPTFHPAYLLRDPHKKREVWEDMKKVREFLQS